MWDLCYIHGIPGLSFYVNGKFKYNVNGKCKFYVSGLLRSTWTYFIRGSICGDSEN